MDILSTIGTAVTAGSALAALVAGLFSYRQKSRVDLLIATNDDLRKANADYKDRVLQVLDENKRLEDRIKALEMERRLPLEELTKLIIQNNAAQSESSASLTKEVANMAKIIAKVADKINSSSDRRNHNE